MEKTTMESSRGGITSFDLHILAMVFMLCDHMWATVIPGNQWLTVIGRMTFPIYAFLIVEGYFHTSNLKRYMKRLLVFAILSELPFNLMYTGLWIFPFHQNVLWNFLISLLCLKSVDKIRARYKGWGGYVLAALAAGGFMLLALVTMTDYYAYGVLTILVFYCFRGNLWYHRLGQFAGLLYINWFMIKGLVIPVTLFGSTFEIPQQGSAVLALLPIWLYNGKQGPHNKMIQYCFYAFYPVHLLVLGLLSKFI